MPAEYVLPIGLHVSSPPAQELEEGYEVHWRDEEDPPHYFFYAQVSALRLERLLHDAMSALPANCHAVLEVRRTDEETEADPDGPAQDRWVSELVSRDEVLETLRRYSVQLLHDGMVGFGAYDPESPLEIFVDDHKLVSLFSPDLEPFERILAAHGVPHTDQLDTALDAEHEHHSLSSVAERAPDERHEWLRRRRYDLDWFAEAIRTRLGMRLQPHCAGEEEAADDPE